MSWQDILKFTPEEEEAANRFVNEETPIEEGGSNWFSKWTTQQNEEIEKLKRKISKIEKLIEKLKETGE